MIVSAYYLAQKFEPEVRSVVVNELNKHLAVPVQVEDINLSLLQRFPYASLRFSKVMIPAMERGKVSEDTLIYIEDLYLQIGLLDFFRKNYKVTEADVRTGFFRMEFYADGSDNFHFWKSTEKEGSNTTFSVKNVDIRNFAYDLATADGLNMSFLVEKSEASGDFGSSVYDISSENKIRISTIIDRQDTLYLNTSFEGDLDLNINTEAGLYTFISSEVSLGELEASLEGIYAPKADQTWNVAMKGKEASLEDLTLLLPLPVREKTRAYNTRGSTDLDLKISWGKDQNIDAAFSDLEGTFQHHEGLGKARIDGAKGKLEIRNDLQSIFLDELKAKIGFGKIEAWGNIIDLGAPSFDLSIAGEIDLNELKKLLNVKLVDELSGKVQVDGNLKGNLPRESSNATVELLRGIDFNGNIELRDGVFKMAGQHQKFDQIKGSIQLKDNAVIITSADARVNDNPFEFSGTIKNALPYISRKGQKLTIIADFKADELNFNKILTSESTSRDTTYNFTLPDDVSFDLGIDIGRLDFRKFRAEEIRGKAYYKSGLLTLNPVSFHTASGKVNANFRVKEKEEDRFEILSTAQLQKLDLSELFEEFENFGQRVIQAKHLEGTADAGIDFAMDFRSDLSIDAPTIRANTDLIVRNGKLKNLESLQDIASYLRSNALWRTLIKVDEFEKRLKVVSFETLENTITIENSVIEIPTMTIRSSALTMNISGTHTFENQIDYALNFKLSDLLRTGREKDTEFGYIREDNTGLNIFLKMEGTVDDPVFSMDNDAARQKRKKQFQKEQTTVKNMLKEEFGLFKSDTTLTGIEPKKEGNNPRFSVDFEEFKEKNDTTDKPRDAREEKKKKKKKKDLFDSDDDL